MGLETGIQALLHTFEQGSFAVWLRRAVIVLIVAAIALIHLLAKFNGFNVPEAMEQAQIGRQLAEGHGYSSLYVRPLALNQQLVRKGKLPPPPFPELTQAPLNPLLNAALLKLPGMSATIADREFVSPAEKAMAFKGFVFFAASLVLAFFLGRRLFGGQIALLAVGMLIGMQLLWRVSFSGLPHMPMLFLFLAALLALAAALDAQGDGRRGKGMALVLAGAFLLGLATLAHGLGFALFAGFWLFAVIVFRPRWLVALAAPAVYVVPLVPWLWHNWSVLRNPFGLPFYEIYVTPQMSKIALLSDFEPQLRFSAGAFLVNTGGQALDLAGQLFPYFGGNLVAVAFFLAVLFLPCARWQAAQFRWAVLLMWLPLTLGMCVFPAEGPVSINQLQMLFLPVMTVYGLAFLLNLWERLEIPMPIMRVAFLVVLYATVSAQLLFNLTLTPAKSNWPPYLPPLMQRFSLWVGRDEAVASDIPWATAWYAGRTSLLLPESIEQFELIHSERFLGMPLVGLYLTPASGELRTYADIINGRYREWARFVLREVSPDDIRSWMLNSAINLPIDGGSIFFSDRARWL